MKLYSVYPRCFCGALRDLVFFTYQSLGPSCTNQNGDEKGEDANWRVSGFWSLMQDACSSAHTKHRAWEHSWACCFQLMQIWFLLVAKAFLLGNVVLSNFLFHKYRLHSERLPTDFMPLCFGDHLK